MPAKERKREEGGVLSGKGDQARKRGGKAMLQQRRVAFFFYRPGAVSAEMPRMRGANGDLAELLKQNNLLCEG